MSAAISGIHSSVSRSMSIVREALVTSVRCSPVNFHISQLSIVPIASSPFSARSRAPVTLSSNHRTLGPAKYVASGRPTRCW